MAEEKDKTAQGTLEVRPLTAITADAERQEYEKRRKEIIRKEDETKTLCWFGTLPGPKTAQVWGEIMGWQGKCEHYQQLSIAGVEFVAFTEELVRSSPTESTKGAVRPGAHMQFSDKQIKKIREAAFKIFYRKVGDKLGYILKEDQIGYQPDPRDVPLAYYVYLVPIKNAMEIPPLDYFFQNPPKSLAGV